MRTRPASRASEASRADKYALYQQAVQSPTFDVTLLSRAFRDARGRAPRVLREDFSGTAAVSCAWVQSRRDRQAFAVDLDPEPLQWCRGYNLPGLSAEERGRIRLLCGDVRAVDTPPVDVVVAGNMSWFALRDRRALRAYLAHAWQGLHADGVLVLDVFGGAALYDEGTEESWRVGRRATYVLEQARFDPVTHEAVFYLHFRFRDGSRLERAFEHRCRLWSIPELRDLLDEVGFSRTVVYWEDPASEAGSGRYQRCTSAPADPAFIAYVAALK